METKAWIKGSVKKNQDSMDIHWIDLAQGSKKCNYGSEASGHITKFSSYCLCAQAQLGSIVTIPWGPINIQSLDELMESDLKLRAHYKLQQTLRKSSEDDPVIREIMARLRPVTKVTELLDQLQSQRKQNFAYLMYRRSLEFYASQSVSLFLAL